MTAHHSDRPGVFHSEIAIVHDAASGAWMIDVTSCRGPIDRAMFPIKGALILACFGDHGSYSCPVTGRPSTGGKHPVTFDVVSGRDDHVAFVRRFEELSRSGVEVLTSAPSNRAGPGRGR